MKKSLHLVSFDVPYPPNYGGVIDVFYKIKALHSLGVSIYLHVFLSDDKLKQPNLQAYCETVFYYKRKQNLFSLLSLNPYRVKSRSSKLLITNLKRIKAPIIFEGLHSLSPLVQANFTNTFVRAHNIEHSYFFGLFKSEKNIFKKVFFYIEALKFKRFEKILENVTGIFSISPFEQKYFVHKYGEKAKYLPAFYEVGVPVIVSNLEKYVLYHGDLRVADNERAALFLIDVYKNTPFKFVVSSGYKNKIVLSALKKHTNISFEEITSEEKLTKLLSNAHVNTLITFQKTGIKLKLLHALYKGKHVLANSKMIEDTGLDEMCELANTKEEILTKTAQLFKGKVSKNDYLLRQEKLQNFCPTKNAEKIIATVFKL